MRTLALYFDGKYSDISVNLWKKKQHSIIGMTYEIIQNCDDFERTKQYWNCQKT